MGKKSQKLLKMYTSGMQAVYGVTRSHSCVVYLQAKVYIYEGNAEWFTLQIITPIAASLSCKINQAIFLIAARLLKPNEVFLHFCVIQTASLVKVFIKCLVW